MILFKNAIISRFLEPCNDLFLEEKSRFRIFGDDLSALRQADAGEPEQGTVVPALHARIANWREKMSRIEIQRPTDEHIDILVDGDVIASFNHDDHGWSGMEAAEQLVIRFAGKLGLEVEEVGCA